MPLRLEDSFADGTLVRPSHREPGIVHLIQAIARLTGVTGIEPTAPMNELLERIGRADHLIFVLLDGLGMSTLRRLPPDSFIASHVRRKLIATCPSTTACALTTVATASFPNQHGISGWFTYLPELLTTAIVLPFKERFSGQPLVERGIRPQDVLRLPPILPRVTHRALTITPSNIANTTYNFFCRGGTAGVGYDTIPHAIDLCFRRSAQNQPQDAAESAFSRWGIEHVFRVAKSEVGFDHFEGRSYLGLIRHMVLCQLVLLFLAEQTTRLRGEKSPALGTDPGADGPRPQRPVPRLAGATL